MSCCGGQILTDVPDGSDRVAGDRVRDEELKASATLLPDGRYMYIFTIVDMHCGSCISMIEKHLSKLKGVSDVRVNLTLKRLTFSLDSSVKTPSSIVDELVKIGYPPSVYINDSGETSDITKQKRLLIDLAVAGFAMANIMLLSVSVWSGAEGATRQLFHLISGLIAVPAVLFSGQSFFSSAYKALRAGYLNMDVPISLAVILTLGMSVFESLHGVGDAYFEASVMLLFFLLIGRYLDLRMKEKAKNVISNLGDLSPRGIEIKGKRGKPVYMPADELKPGMVMLIKPGDRIPVDGVIIKGHTELDRSLVTGESMPVAASVNAHIDSGILNLSAPIEVEVLRGLNDSFLSGLISIIEECNAAGSRYISLADRMVKLYAPSVHILALVAFVGWAFFTGGDYHTSMNIAISVLIITCPCALGLAVPMVQVAAASRLFQNGIVLKNGPALEKLSEIDHVVFDKTGTLTTGTPQANSDIFTNRLAASLAHSLARISSHPASKAVAALLKDQTSRKIEEIEEIPGKGVRGLYRGSEIRLGRCDWVSELTGQSLAENHCVGDLYFGRKGHKAFRFEIIETLRPGAKQVIDGLKKLNISVEIVSGDTYERVQDIAKKLGINTFSALMSPQDKLDILKTHNRANKKVLMIGDGLNDAPSLSMCHVSMAPGSASDVSRLAADFVFLRDSLKAVIDNLEIARNSQKLMKQNFALAFVYNCIAIPIAFAGLVTPLLAAIAMSVSSILVVANSLRLHRMNRSGKVSPAYFEKLERVSS